MPDGLKHTGELRVSRKRDEGSLTVFFWSVSGIILASCGGGGGSSFRVDAQELPAFGASSGGVRGVDVYADIHGDGTLDNAAFIDTTNSLGEIEVPGRYQGMRLLAVFEGAVEEHTGDGVNPTVLTGAGVYRSLPGYTGQDGRVLISPLTELLADAETTQAQQAILDDIFGSGRVSVSDILDPGNYFQGIDAAGDEIRAGGSGSAVSSVQQLVSRAAVAYNLLRVDSTLGTDIPVGSDASASIADKLANLFADIRADSSIGGADIGANIAEGSLKRQLDYAVTGNQLVGDSRGVVTEDSGSDGQTAGGDLSIADAFDGVTDTATIRVEVNSLVIGGTARTFTGTYGSFQVSRAGADITWSYTINNVAAQALDGVASRTHQIRLDVTEGASNDLDQYITVTIRGVNDAPIVATNTGLALNEGATAAITSLLLATDVDDVDNSLTYTITGGLEYGSLMLGDDVVTSFTGADLATLMYVHDGSHEAADSFAFTVSDDEGGSVSGTFNITVTLANDDPDLAPEDAEAENILDKSRATTISGRLHFSDEETALAMLDLERDTGSMNFVALGETHAGSYGTFTFTVNAEAGVLDWRYTLNAENPAVVALTRGALMDSIVLAVKDADDARGTYTLQVNITADSHEVSLQAPGSVEIEYDTGLPADSSATGMFTTYRGREVELEYSAQTSAETPVVAVSSLRVGFTHRVDGDYGSLFYHEATGAYEYIANIMTLDNYTGSEETLSDSFAITVDDGFSTDSGSLEVSITGLESDYDQVHVTPVGGSDARYSGYRADDGSGLLKEEEDGTAGISLGTLGGGTGANTKTYAVLSGEAATADIFEELGISDSARIAKIMSDSAVFAVTQSGHLNFTGSASGDFDLRDTVFYDVLLGVTDLGADGVAGGGDDSTTHEIYRVYLIDKNEVPIFNTQFGSYSRNSIDFSLDASVKQLGYRVIAHDSTEDDGIVFDSATGRLTITMRRDEDGNLPTIEDVENFVDPSSGDFGNLLLVSAEFDADNMAGHMLTTAYPIDWSGSGFTEGHADVVATADIDLGRILSTEAYILRESVFGVSDADIVDQDDEGRADGSIIMYRLDAAPSAGNIQLFNGTNWVNLADDDLFSLEALRDEHVRYMYSPNQANDTEVTFSLSADDDDMATDGSGLSAARSAVIDYVLEVDFAPILHAETVVLYGIEFTRPIGSAVTHATIFTSSTATYPEALQGEARVYLRQLTSRDIATIIQNMRNATAGYLESQGNDRAHFEIGLAEGFMGTDVLHGSNGGANPLHIAGIDLPDHNAEVPVAFGMGIVYEGGDIDVRTAADGTTTPIVSTTTSTYGEIAYRDIANVATGLTIRVALTEAGLSESSAITLTDDSMPATVDGMLEGEFGTFEFMLDADAGSLRRENAIDASNKLTNVFTRNAADTSTGLLRWDYALSTMADNVQALTGEDRHTDSIWIEVVDSDGNRARQEVVVTVRGQDLSPVIASEPSPLVIANEGMIALDETIIPVSDLDTPIEDGVFTIESLDADVVIRLTNADGTTDLEATETFTYASLVADEISLHHITSGGTDLGFSLSFSNGEGDADTSTTRAYVVALEGYAHAAVLAATPTVVMDGMTEQIDEAFLGLTDADHAMVADIPDTYTFTASSLVHGMLLRGTTPITANSDGAFTFTLGEVRSTDPMEQIFFQHTSGQSDASFDLTVTDDLGVHISVSETYNIAVPERPSLTAGDLWRDTQVTNLGNVASNGGTFGLLPTHLPGTDPDLDPVDAIPGDYVYTISDLIGGNIVVRRDVGGTPMDVTLTNGGTFTYGELNSVISGSSTRTVRIVDSIIGDSKVVRFTLTLSDDTAGTPLVSEERKYQVIIQQSPPLISDPSTGNTITLGGTYDVTTDDFEVIDVDNPQITDPITPATEGIVPGGFVFTVVSQAGGEIRLNDVASTTFTLAQVRANEVDFVHDNRTPSGIQFELRVTDGLNNPSADTIEITFLDVTVPPRAPVLTTTAGSTGNTFTSGEYTLLTGDFMLTDADLETIPRTFSLIASGFTGVTLRVGTTMHASGPVTFNMGQVIDGDVVFIHDGTTESGVHFDLQARDGTSLTSSMIEIGFATVDLPDPPVLSNPSTGLTIDASGGTFDLTTDHFDISDPDVATIPGHYTFTVSNRMGGVIEVDGTAQDTFTMQNLRDDEVDFVHDDRTGTGIRFTLTVNDGANNDGLDSDPITITFADVEVGTPPLLRADTVTIAGLRFTILDETLPFGGFNVIEWNESTGIISEGGVTTLALGARTNTTIQDVINAVAIPEVENKLHAELVSGNLTDSFETSFVLEADRLTSFEAIDEFVLPATTDQIANGRMIIGENFLKIIDPDATLPLAGNDYTFWFRAISNGQLVEVGQSIFNPADPFNRNNFTLTDVRNDVIRFDRTTGAGDGSFTLEVIDGDGNMSTRVTYHVPLGNPTANANAPTLDVDSRTATISITDGSNVVHGIRFTITDDNLGTAATQFYIEQDRANSATAPEIFIRESGAVIAIVVPQAGGSGTPPRPESPYHINDIINTLNVRHQTLSNRDIAGRFDIEYVGTATEMQQASIDFTAGVPLSRASVDVPPTPSVPITSSATTTATAGQPFVLDHETLIRVSDGDVAMGEDIPADYRFEVQSIANGRLTVVGRDGNLGVGDFFTMGQLRADQVTYTPAYGTNDGTLTLTVNDGFRESTARTYTFDVPDTLPNAAAPVLDMERTATFYHTDNIHGIKFTWLPGAAGRPTEALVIQETSSGTFLANNLGNPPHIKVYMGTGLVAPYLSLERIIQIVNTPEGTIPANHLHAEYVGPPGGEDTILGHYYNNSSFYIRAPISPSETSNTIDIANGGSLILDENFIRVSDADIANPIDIPDNYTFTIVSVTNGSVIQGITTLNPTNTFTMEDLRSDVASEQITFQHMSGMTDGTLELTVSDGTNISTALTYTFDVPQVGVLTALADTPDLNPEFSDTVESYAFSALPFTLEDPDDVVIPDNFTFTASNPRGGNVYRGRSPTEDGEVVTEFTYHEVRRGQIDFYHDGSTTTQQGISVDITVTDPDDGLTSAPLNVVFEL